MRQLNEIIIHCTATPPNWMDGKTALQKVAEVRKWHVKDRGWKDIGYHYLIDRDGSVEVGRKLEEVGAHTQGHNTGTIGISLVGGHGSAKNDAFEANFTPEQDLALRELIAELKSKYTTIKKVSGHNQYANKACPGFNVPTWVEKKPQLAERTNIAQSTTMQASVVQVASGAGAGVAAIGALDGTAQIVAIVFAGIVILAGLYVMKERIRKWSQEGDR